MRLIDGLWAVLIANVVLGVPAYFISFLFAYGFKDDVGLGAHVTFLVLITAYAALSGAAAMALPWMSEPRPPAVRRAAFGVQMSLSVNMVFLAAGSIVSATHKDEGSVSADFSTATDVLVFCGLLVLAAALAAAAVRVDLRLQPNTRFPSSN